MILEIIYILCIFQSPAELRKISTCLTGYMTDVQSWVDEEGSLMPSIEYQNAIDLSSNLNPLPILQQKMDKFRASPYRKVRYLSLAKCMLTRVPPIFQTEESGGRWLSETVEYVTFYGNTFLDMSMAGQQYDVDLSATDAEEIDVGLPYQTQTTSIWSIGLQGVLFLNLRELDLRACSIQVLRSKLFSGMPRLEALYLGENQVHFIEADAFVGLNNLMHLDFSRNEEYEENGIPMNLVTPTEPVFEKLTNLTSLDLSFTKLTQRNAGVLRGLGSKLTRLSICDTGLTNLQNRGFSQTSIRILDISNNNGLLSRANGLKGIEDTLQIIYAKGVGLSTVDIFQNFHKLEVLKLLQNEISVIPPEIAESWNNLQVLDLNANRLTSWFQPTFSLMPKLRYLTIKNNNINVLSEEIIKDFSNVTYLALSGNFIVCNCHTRDLLELAARNEITYKILPIKPRNYLESTRFEYHIGFDDFNALILKRIQVSLDCEDCNEEDLKINGDFVLVDYKDNTYNCLSAATGESVHFSTVPSCRSSRDIDYDRVIMKGHNKLLALLVIPCILLPMLVGFIFRRNLHYFLITLRNSAMLSLIDKKETIDDDTIFTYDVFVSYCNEDRGWVLDHLLPQLESDCSISACLHERDFQVGLSILENIVSCMDRSRSIMLIISQRFLMSQWCQFEMHLAQHRLLETRREDLTLVLLEEIPRRLRPTTLHYLMLTKTYIIWPKVDTQRALFWKRLRKSLVAPKLRQTENVSLA